MFSPQACNLQSALTNRQQGESSSALMQLAFQKEPVYPAGSRGMRGGLTGTQVERDEENQTETLWMVTPSLAPSITLFFPLNEQMHCTLCFLDGVVKAAGGDRSFTLGVTCVYVCNCNLYQLCQIKCFEDESAVSLVIALLVAL